MTDLDWSKPPPSWDGDATCLARAQTSLLYLVVHGVITDGERDRAVRRLRKLVAKWRARQVPK